LFNDMDGALPVGGLLFDKNGNLDGTTYTGGAAPGCGNGCGVVFQLSESENTWTETVLHNFAGSDGAGPASSLTIDPKGNLYGVTFYGGTYGGGTFFKVIP
jgi:uncharacterized repeat protein (TIGR03803 family)